MTVPPWSPLEEQRRQAGVLSELRELAAPLDALLIAAVPTLLVAVFLVQGDPDESLVLARTSPSPTSLVTTHFVHRSSAHLVDNLAIYWLVVPTAYALAVLGRRRREFLVAFVGFLLGLPPVLSGLDLLLFERGVTLGFSGVTMAFVGLLALDTGRYVDARLGDGWAGDPAPALFFGGLALVAARTVSAPGPRIALASGAVLIAGYYVRGAAARRSLEWLRSDDGRLGALGVFVLAIGLVAGFPAGSGTGPVVVNAFGHFVGFVAGFAGPYLAFPADAPSRPGEGSPPEAV